MLAVAAMAGCASTENALKDANALLQEREADKLLPVTNLSPYSLALGRSGRMLDIYNEDAAARQLILAQHGLSEVVQADRQHDMELGDLMHKLFDQHFHLPVMPLDVDVFALAMELSDRVYARSVQLHEAITPRMAEEGKRVFEAYLGLYLPPFLAKRSS